MFPTWNFIIRESSLLVKKVSGRSVFQRLNVIRLGDPLPQCDLYENFPTSIIKLPDVVVGKNVILFGVPGAFTPGCSKTHMPGFLRIADEMRNNGIEEIICVSVNDPYVMGAWAAKHKTKGKIRMLADPDGSFIGGMGLGMRIATLGGYRSKRFSMVVIDNKVKELNVEPDGTGLSCSLASELDYKKHIKTAGEELF